MHRPNKVNRLVRFGIVEEESLWRLMVRSCCDHHDVCDTARQAISSYVDAMDPVEGVFSQNAPRIRTDKTLPRDYRRSIQQRAACTSR